MWKYSDLDFGCVYEDGYQTGLIGDCEPEDNPWNSSDEREARYHWGEGFFDGYKQYLAAQQQENNNVK